MRYFRLVGCVIVLMLFTGCALVDRNIPLTYKCSNLESGKNGNFYIEKPKEITSLPHNKKGQSDIGDIRNSYGMRTADVVTTTDIGEWIASAYAQELTHAGYSVHTVPSLSEETTKGVRFAFKHINIDTDIDFFTIGAIAQVNYNILVFIDGKKVGTIDVEGASETRAGVISDEMYSTAIQQALGDAVKKSLPYLLKIAEKKNNMISQSIKN